MTGTEIKKYILNVEKEYSVNEWRLQGIYIWPFIRIKLYIFFLNLSIEKSLPKIKGQPFLENRSIIKKGFNFLQRIINAKLMMKNFNRNLKPKKIIFFGSHFHRTQDNGVYLNRFFDPMVDEYQLQDEVYMVEFEKVYENNYNQKAILPLHKYLDQYKLLKRINPSLFLQDKGEIELNGYNAFFERLIDEFPAAQNLNISIEGLNRWAKKVNRTKGFFTDFFKKTKPEKIIFLSYYGYDDLAAAILAAHELGIKTIDFQHGPQTNVHMAYSSWTKHPEKPYNIMPLEYWVWDQKSMENIEKWAQETVFIKAKIVGHPYLAYFKKTILFKENMCEKIFFSLQTLSLEEMFPILLLDLMKELEWKWVLRLHPRSNFTKNDLKSFLEINKIYNSTYEIENALDTPLPKSLASAKLHVTNFSGCVIEAGMLNIPSLLIHDSGKEIFRAYIDNKSIFYLNPGEPEFMEKFKNILESLPENSNERELREIPNPLA